MRSPKIKMTMTNAKIGDYPIAPRGRVPFEYHHGNANGPHSSLLYSPFLSSVCTPAIGLAVTQSRVCGCGLWAAPFLRP